MPPVKAAPQPAGAVVVPGARVSIRGGIERHGNGLAVTVACPRGLGELGCRGLLSARFRAAGHPWRAAGRTAYEVASGETDHVVVPASPGLRRALRKGLRVHLRLLAATRGEAGAVRVTRVHRSLRG